MVLLGFYNSNMVSYIYYTEVQPLIPHLRPTTDCK